MISISDAFNLMCIKWRQSVKVPTSVTNNTVHFLFVLNVLIPTLDETINMFLESGDVTMIIGKNCCNRLSVPGFSDMNHT